MNEANLTKASKDIFRNSLCLSKEFDVITLSISGNRELKILSYLQIKADSKVRNIDNQSLDLSHLYKIYVDHEDVKKKKYQDVLKYNKELNFLLHNNKVQEDKRSLLVTTILVALKNDKFRANLPSFSDYNANQVAGYLVDTVIKELQKSNISNTKVAIIKNSYSFYITTTNLTPS